MHRLRPEVYEGSPTRPLDLNDSTAEFLDDKLEETYASKINQLAEIYECLMSLTPISKRARESVRRLKEPFESLSTLHNPSSIDSIIEQGIQYLEGAFQEIPRIEKGIRIIQESRKTNPLLQ